MKKFLLLFVVLVFSCRPNNSLKKTETKFFGDSLKIEYTYIGDTVYQKRMDLKDKKDPNNSFDVKSVWNTKKIEKLNCEKTIKISKEKILYIFCIDDVLDYTQKQLKRKKLPIIKDSILKFQRKLLNIENGERDTIIVDNFHFIYDLVKSINCKIVVSKEDVVTVRIESYETNFSGGNIYYLLNKKNDTIQKYHLQDWIK